MHSLCTLYLSGLQAGLVLETNFGSFSRMRWSRASRTDKGVHSLGTVRVGRARSVDMVGYVSCVLLQ